MTNIPNEILTFAETCAYLRLGAPKVRELLNSKQIPHRRIGTRIRIHKTAIDEWMMADRAERVGLAGEVEGLARQLAELEKKIERR